MYKRTLMIILSMVLVLLLSSCSCGKSFTSFEKTGYDNLWYDTKTHIVYYSIRYKLSTYYCEHGLPYRFNPITRELECINN